MPSLKDMRGKAKEAGLMKLDKLIATRQRIPNCEFPIRSGNCANAMKSFTPAASTTSCAN